LTRITPSLLATLILAAAGAGAAYAAKPHEHGVVKLDVAVEGDKLTVALEAPLDNLLGFERAPRTEAERKAASEVMARLRAPAGLFAADAAAQCALAKTDVQAPVLEGSAKAKDGHADLDATYEFKCAQPAQLRALDVGLFEAYKRIQRIDVQVAGPQGQSKTTLRRPARSVKLVK